jgi:DegV family protein with EDD domain
MSNDSHRIGILTDSTCDLPQELRDRHDIYVVPQLLIWGEETLRDGFDIDGPTFYKRLPHDPVHPKTSQPSVGDFVEYFNQMKGEYDEIVAVLISHHLSGSIASAEGAKGMVDIPVHVVNSYSVSLGLGAVVMAAVQAREAGADVAAIVAAAEERARHTRIVFVVDTLDYLHKGGRIGGAAKLVGTALNLKPLLYIHEGRVEPLERIRTRSKALDRMLEVATDGIDTTQPIGGAVLHAEALEDAVRVAERYQEMYSPVEFMMGEVTPIIGVHGGPGVLGVVTYTV